MTSSSSQRLDEVSRWPKLYALELLDSIAGRSFSTLPFFVFGTDEWASASDDLIHAILDADLGPIVVVRSCAALEDAVSREPPGFFDSVLDVKANGTDLRSAVEKVIASYARRQIDVPIPHKVIVQRQFLAPLLCGVCRVGPTANDYIDVDYDDTLGRTDSVTAGVKAKRVVLSPCRDLLISPWRGVSELAEELGKFFPAPFFVEFALDATGKPTVFQIRPDRRPHRPLRERGRANCELLRVAAELVEKSGPLSNMADWNPAEMLGLRPMPLDVSLYDELLMRSAWAVGRTSIGWCKPSDPNLMTVVAGQPYIKLVPSLQSLLPQGLPQRLVERLVADRLVVLSADRQLHDKVEFRLMWSALAFDHRAVDRDLRAREFSPDEIQQLFRALAAVTRNAIEAAPRLLETDRLEVRRLNIQRQHLNVDVKHTSPNEAEQIIRNALDVCKAYGTIPFSRQARLAFMFRYIINHLVETDSVQPNEVALWQQGLNTVARQLSLDLAHARSSKKSQESFLSRYGHLRPSTYNLESLRYDERSIPAPKRLETTSSRSRSPGWSRRLSEILSDSETAVSQSCFWAAAASAYKGREEMKFAFTALLSDVLRLLTQIGSVAGLERKDLRRLHINALLKAMEESDSWSDFRRLVMTRMSVGQPSWQRITLPDVIFNPCDLHIISDYDARPTFVGSHVAKGAPFQISANSSAEPGKLSGAIVAIETPDPGYDWIFGHPIEGLVSAYGGEFSHMGLRCAEFGVPAAIGCGQRIFASLVQARTLELDPLVGELWADGARLLPS